MLLHSPLKSNIDSLSLLLLTLLLPLIHFSHTIPWLLSVIPPSVRFPLYCHPSKCRNNPVPVVIALFVVVSNPSVPVPVISITLELPASVTVVPFTVTAPPKVVSPVPVVIALFVVVSNPSVPVPLISIMLELPASVTAVPFTVKPPPKVVNPVPVVIAPLFVVFNFNRLALLIMIFPVVAPPIVNVLLFNDWIVDVDANVSPYPFPPSAADILATGLFVSTPSNAKSAMLLLSLLKVVCGRTKRCYRSTIWHLPEILCQSCTTTPPCGALRLISNIDSLSLLLLPLLLPLIHLSHTIPGYSR